MEAFKTITPINVIAEFTVEGCLVPMAVRWKDGRIFDIEHIRYSNNCMGLMTSRKSHRYLVIISGEERNLYYEANGQWYIENRRGE